MAKYIRRYFIPALCALAGAAVGLIYYALWGCESGCAITSSPALTALWLAAIGWLLASALINDSKKDDE